MPARTNRDPVDLAIDLDRIWKEYKKSTKGHTEEEKFDTDDTRQLHECCRQTQNAIGEDPQDLDMLRHRGFIDGDYDKAVKSLIEDAKAGQRWVKTESGEFVREAI